MTGRTLSLSAIEKTPDTRNLTRAMLWPNSTNGAVLASEPSKDRLHSAIPHDFGFSSRIVIGIGDWHLDCHGCPPAVESISELISSLQIDLGAIVCFRDVLVEIVELYSSRFVKLNEAPITRSDSAVGTVSTRMVVGIVPEKIPTDGLSGFSEYRNQTPAIHVLIVACDA